MISILVPFCNPGPYFIEALGSIVKQRVEGEDIEIILLDDGSTDSSLSTARRFASEDGRIRIIEGPNMGVGHARNTLLKEAVGEYVFFSDADDILSDGLVEKLWRAAKEHEAPVAAACVVHFHRYHYTPLSARRGKTMDGISYARLMVRPTGVSCYPHSRLMKKELFNGFSFPEDMIFEDVVTMPWVVRRAESVVTVPSAFYFYRHHGKSLSHSPFSEASLSEMDAYMMNTERSVAEKDRKMLASSAVFFLTKYIWYGIKTLFLRRGIREYGRRYNGDALRAMKLLLFFRAV